LKHFPGPVRDGQGSENANVFLPYKRRIPRRIMMSIFPDGPAGALSPAGGLESQLFAKFALFAGYFCLDDLAAQQPTL
jgi:hypothetical protein